MLAAAPPLSDDDPETLTARHVPGSLPGRICPWDPLWRTTQGAFSAERDPPGPLKAK